MPLDPSYPQERLSYMVDDTNMKVILSQQRLLATLPEDVPPVVCLDSKWRELSGQSEKNPLSGIVADNLAYLIYTSGSTGEP